MHVQGRRSGSGSYVSGKIRTSSYTQASFVFAPPGLPSRARHSRQDPGWQPLYGGNTYTRSAAFLLGNRSTDTPYQKTQAFNQTRTAAYVEFAGGRKEAARLPAVFQAQ